MGPEPHAGPDHRSRHRQQRGGLWLRPRLRHARPADQRHRQGGVAVFTRARQRNLAPLSYQGYPGLRSEARSLRAARRGTRVAAFASSCGPAHADARGRRHHAADLARSLGSRKATEPSSVTALRRGELGRSATSLEVRIHIDGREMPISGVAPPRLEGLYSGRVVDVWIPLKDDAIRGLDRTESDLHCDWTSARRHLDRRRAARLEPGRRGEASRGSALQRAASRRRPLGCRG